MSSNEPEFRAWRRRLLNRYAILCALAMPVGLFIAVFRRFQRITLNPSERELIGLVVALLGLIGLIVSLVKIEKLK